MKIIPLDKGCFAFIFGLLLWCSHVHANYNPSGSTTMLWQSAVSGTVSDGTGPLPGVTIYVKGTSRSVVSDELGRYAISAGPGETIVFSFMGFKEREAIVSTPSLDIVLEEDTAELQEVVINAGYYSVKDKERTGSIARITAKDIDNQPVTNVLATMQGRMAGVSVTQTTGMPGGGFDIQIRGQNSLRLEGNAPLYIIDGVPYSSESIGSSYTSGNMPVQNSPLTSINPGDIANIEVLKDADATAIYGSRGANGVVLITTRKGREGKTSFTANYTSGMGKVTGFMDLMGTAEYLAMRREAFANDGVAQYPADAYDVNGTWDQQRSTDWQREIIGGTAEYNTLQASVSGGSAQTQFLLSGSYNKETTVYPGDFRYTRANGRFNLTHASSDQKFKVSFSAGYTFQNTLLPPIDLTRDALTLAPNAPELYDATGNLNWDEGRFNNPLAKIEGDMKGKTHDLIANSVFSYDFGWGFGAKCSFGYTDLRQHQINTGPSTGFNPVYGLGSEVSSVYSNTLGRNSWIVEPQLSWDKSIGRAELQVLAGTTFQRQDGSQVVSYGEGFASNSLIENPASAAFYMVLGSDRSVYKYHALFGRVNFKWDGKYILNLTGRRDGSSRFGPGKQFGTFGAVGAAWLFSEEKFMEQFSFVSFGKLRASYGTSGNDQIGDYQYLDSYSTSGNNYQGSAGLMPSRLFNPEFGWETNKKLEVALEMGLLQDRITGSIGLYRNRSSSQLVGIPLPATTGFTELLANLDAEVQNSGFEFTLNTVNIRTKHFTWSTGFNLTRAKNKLLSFPGLEASTYANRYVLGQPLNIVKVYHYTGIDPQTGTYTFEDINGDGNISATEDKKVIKDLNPEFFGGFQNQFSYKGLTLDFLFQFVKQLNFDENYRMVMPGTMANQPQGVTQHWQMPGGGPYQAYSNSGSAAAIAHSRFTQSDAAIGDASYIRLKNISLSYDLPQDWTGKLNLRLSLQGQNLLTISRYKGLDPEFRSSGYLPPLRVFSSSLQISF